MNEQTDNVAKLQELMKSLPAPGAAGAAGSGFGRGLEPANSAAMEAVPLPGARCAVSVREATLDDVPFIDGLQKMHTHMVGWFPRKQMESYIEGGHVLIAEASEPRPSGSGLDVDAAPTIGTSSRGPRGPLPDGRGSVGYIIAKDQYMKRDDVGIVYQLNVMPMKQRHLIGATLVQAAFDRAAYGCKLYCCWCAQDIQANWFWESIGFVPLAFRTGSRAKQRIHIFWQRRVRDDDAGPGATPYWFPHQTQGGAVAEDRIVLPIPPGTHWRDAKPLVLPQIDASEPRLPGSGEELPKQLPGGASVKARPVQEQLSAVQKAVIQRTQARELGGVPLGKKAVITPGGVRYVERADYVPELDAPEELKAMERAEEEAKKKKREASRRPRAKSDPKLVKAARELRDRYLECVNEHACAQLPPGAMGRYDVSKALGRPGAAGPGNSRRSDAVDAGRTLPRSSVSDDRLLDAA